MWVWFDDVGDDVVVGVDVGGEVWAGVSSCKGLIGVGEAVVEGVKAFLNGAW